MSIIITEVETNNTKVYDKSLFVTKTEDTFCEYNNYRYPCC